MIKEWRKFKKWITGKQTRSPMVQDYRVVYTLLVTIAIGVWSDALVSLLVQF